MRKTYDIINKGAKTTSVTDIALQKLPETEYLIENSVKKLLIEGDVIEGINDGYDAKASCGDTHKRSLCGEQPIPNSAR